MKIKNENKKYTQIAIYVVITCIVIYSLSLIANNITTIMTHIMARVGWLIKVIKPVILGFIIAYLFGPIVNFFQRQLGKVKVLKNKEKKCRSIAVLVTIFLGFCVIIAMISLLVFSVTDQLRLANLDDIIVLCNEYVAIINDFSKNIMEQLNNLDIESAQLTSYFEDVGTYIVTFLKSLAQGAIGSVSNISGMVTTFVFGLIVGIYFLIDGEMISNYLSKVCNALFSDKWNARVNSVLKDADMVFSGYIRGQLMDVFVMMVLISIALSIVGVKFAVVIGICAGIGNLIPYCGPFVAYGGTAIICLLNGDYKQLIIGVIVLFIIQTVDGNYIGPKLLSQSIDIHPLMVIIFLFFGSAIGGLGGMLLAVPVGAFIKVLFVKFIDNRLEKKEKKKEMLKKEEQ